MGKVNKSEYWHLHLKINRLDFKAIAIVAWIIAAVVAGTLWPKQFFGFLFSIVGFYLAIPRDRLLFPFIGLFGITICVIGLMLLFC